MTESFRVPSWLPSLTDSPLSALVAALEAVDLPRLVSYRVVDVVAAWEQVIAAATAAQATAIRETASRLPAQHERYTADEVAAALSSTRAAAQRKVDLALGLPAVPGLQQALTTGAIDVRKAHVVVEEVAAAGAHPRTDASTAAAVADSLAHADEVTAPGLRVRLRRRLLAADPDAGARRAERAVADRCVTLTPAGDAMAWLTALLPAPAAVAAFTVLDALADEHTQDDQRSTDRRTDDRRTADQRRADAFTDIFTSILDTGVSPVGPLPRRHGARPAVQVTVAASTLAGLDEHPGDLTGYGPIPAPLARSLARHGTWRRLLTDDSGTVLHRGRRTMPPGQVLGDGAPDDTVVACGHQRPAPDSGPGVGPGVGSGVGLGVGLGVGPGSSDPPPRGEVGYRPGATLAADVVARDRTCRFPGCGQPAQRCDLDHVVPFDPALPAVEQTVADNLQALCRHHHQGKTHGLWSAARDPVTGITWWRSPLGHTYHRTPATVVYAGPPGGEHSPAPPPASSSAPDEPPPF